MRRFFKWCRAQFPRESGVFFILYVTALFAVFVGLFAVLIGPLSRQFVDLLNILNTEPKDTENIDPRYYLAFLGIITATGALIGYAFSFIRVFSNERQVIATEQGHITDRINKAVENLGTNRADGTINTEVRIGAIYALERIAQDSARDHIHILEILSAYIRANAPADTAVKVPDGDEFPKSIKPRIDIQIALTVIGRTPAKRADGKPVRVHLQDCNLQGADLSGADLQRANLLAANLQRANLLEADLQEADLSITDLRGADLQSANLQGTNLFMAHLQGADLRGANLQGTNLFEADLQGADLRGANLQGANLGDADLQGADLWAANLQGVNLEEADLQRADLLDANLQEADLHEADLKNSLLAGADLSSSESLTQQQVDSAFGDGATTLPASLIRPAHWPDIELFFSKARIEWETWREDPDGYTPPTR